jgi:hypothetical protein
MEVSANRRDVKTSSGIPVHKMTLISVVSSADRVKTFPGRQLMLMANKTERMSTSMSKSSGVPALYGR